MAVLPCVSAPLSICQGWGATSFPLKMGDFVLFSIRVGAASGLPTVQYRLYPCGFEPLCTYTVRQIRYGLEKQTTNGQFYVVWHRSDGTEFDGSFHNLRPQVRQ
jgi:hypothetical protein